MWECCVASFCGAQDAPNQNTQRKNRHDDDNHFLLSPYLMFHKKKKKNIYTVLDSYAAHFSQSSVNLMDGLSKENDAFIKKKKTWNRRHSRWHLLNRLFNGFVKFSAWGLLPFL